MKNGMKKKTIKPWIITIVVLLLAAGGYGAYSLWLHPAPTAQGESQDYQTTKVRTGSIVLSATGTGTLIAGEESDLSFSTSGTVETLNVSLGDKVTKGDVLAELSPENLQTLQDAVTTATVNLASAKSDLADLESSANSNLADAEVALAEAKETYTDAQSSLKWTGLARCDEDTIDDDYQKYQLYQKELNQYSQSQYDDSAYYRANIQPIETLRNQYYNQYVYCSGYTDYEITSSQADLVKAEANVKTTQATLDELKANSGIDPDTLLEKENAVSSAQLALEQAQKNLAGGTLVAPFDGTILSVAGEAGDDVGTSTFITIADLEHPKIQFYLDETDMANVAVGYEADVTFDILPDTTFEGTVTQIDPSLQSVNGSMVVEGLAEIDLSDASADVNLPLNASAAVDIIGGKAENVPIVPVEALTDLGDGTYSAFVVENGQLTMHVVEVGLMDYSYAEVKSGLEVGDVVSTGISEVSNGQ